MNYHDSLYRYTEGVGAGRIHRDGGYTLRQEWIE